MQSLNKNREFQEILKKKKLRNEYFTIYFGKKIEELNKKNKKLNISFVMKKKVGNSVKRNKIKRKLKSAVQKILNGNNEVCLDYRYIVFGKSNIYKEKFSTIFNQVDNAFKKIKNSIR